MSRANGSAVSATGDELGNELLRVLERQRAGEEVALPEIAALIPELAALNVLLDPLGHGLELERSTELEQATDDGRNLVSVDDRADERPIDLQDVDRELPQVAERRVPGAEVVDRQPDAQATQLVQPLGSHRRVLHEHGLGHLQYERARREPRMRQGVGDV